jgi:WD40 repeat protein
LTGIESLKFSPDGRCLAAAGGSPGEFGKLQVWDPEAGVQAQANRIGLDSLFGVDWSPDGARLSAGGADRVTRVVQVADGRELVRFDQHTDWVMGTAFLHDGKRLVAASRDKSLKLIDAASSVLLDFVNRDSEPIRCIAFHPKHDAVVLGTEVRPRYYKAQAKPDNFDPNQDPNFVREFNHFDNGVTALAISLDGRWLASSGNPPGEVRVQDLGKGSQKATLRWHGGMVFATAFSVDGERVFTAGSEGVLRVFDWARERLLTNAIPVPVVRLRPVAATDRLAK